MLKPTTRAMLKVSSTRKKRHKLLKTPKSNTRARKAVAKMARKYRKQGRTESAAKGVFGHRPFRTGK